MAVLFHPRGAYRSLVPPHRPSCDVSSAAADPTGVLPMQKRVWLLIVATLAVPGLAFGQGPTNEAKKASALRVPANLKLTRQAPMDTKRAITADAGQTPATADKLTEDQLKDMLEKMGYEVKAEGQPGSRYFEVSESRWYLSISLSSDGSTIWCSAVLNKIPTPAKAPSEKLLGLLSASGSWGYFTYFSQNKIGVIERDLPNKRVTPAALKKTLSNMASVMTDTQSIWVGENAFAP